VYYGGGATVKGREKRKKIYINVVDGKFKGAWLT